MLRNRIKPFWLTGCAGIILFVLTSCASSHQPAALFTKSGMLFPLEDTHIVNKLYDFGIAPWDEERPHNGIDIVPRFKGNKSQGLVKATRSVPKTKVIAPAAGVVRAIMYLDNPYAIDASLSQWILVIVEVNPYWHYAISFEPKSAQISLQKEQFKSINISVGQHLARGQEMGYLVIGDGGGVQYPHIHFSVFYKAPEVAYAELLAIPTTYQVHDGTNVPSTLLTDNNSLLGPSITHMPERDLGIKPTFFCPYHFSTAKARALYDATTKMNGVGGHCSSVCAYQSENGDCGSGSVTITPP